MTSRRSMLTGAAAMTTTPFWPGAVRSAGAPTEDLEAAPANFQIAPADYPRTEIRRYVGTVPGTEIRLRQGDRLRRRLVISRP